MNDGFVLTDQQLEDLAEICTVGAGSAVTSFYKKSGHKCKMDIPQVFIISLHEIKKLFFKEDILTANIIQQVFGDIPSSILFLMDRRDAHMFSEMIIRKKEQSRGKDFTFSAKYALLDLGSTLANAFVEAVNKFLNVSARITMPELLLGTWNEVLEKIINKIGASDEKVIVVHSCFINEQYSIEGKFIYLLNLESVSKLFNKIKEIDPE